MPTERTTPKSRPASRKLLAPTKPSATSEKKVEPAQTSPSEKTTKANPVRVLFSWISPERIWQPKSQVWYLTSALVILVCILVAVKLESYVFVVALLAFLLLWFVQGTMAPWDVKHQITSQGIYSFETFHRWDELAYFWFAKRENWILLYFDFRKELNQPRLVLLVNKDEDLEIFNLIIDYLKYGEMYEVGYNIFAKMIYGEYLPISHYIPDLDQPTTQELKSVSTAK
jgi:hypothetical protein